MLTPTKLMKFILHREKEMYDFLKKHVIYDDPPEREPAPFVPEKIPRNETHAQMMQSRNRDLVRQGKAVSANLMKPAKRPPRAPGQQHRSWNGAWWYY